MSFISTARELEQIIAASTSREALKESLSFATQAMRFRFFALGHHPRLWAERDSKLRIHNYPPEWEQTYDRRRLATCDPVHRASHIIGCGFQWRDLRSIIQTTEQDEAMLLEGEMFGIQDGFTIPTNVPGQPHGSVTFATSQEAVFPEDMIFYAERVAHVAFETARSLDGQRRPLQRLPVTDRQLEVAFWVGRDKSNWDIAQILGVKEDTVCKHVRALCDRLGGVRRTSLPLRAICSGLLCISDFWQ